MARPELTLELREWTSLGPDQSDVLWGLYPSDDRAFQQSVDMLNRSGMVTFTELRQGLQVETNSYVGKVQVGPLTISIRPKLDNLPLSRLLRYTYGLRNLKLSGLTSIGTEQLGLVDLLICQLLAEVEELRVRGLHRRYLRSAEWLESPKGRLDMRKLAGRPVEKAALPCVYHERTEDCLINQVLLAGCTLAASLASDRVLKMETHRLAAALSVGVSCIRLDQEVLARLDQQSDRLVQAYQPALTIIRLLLGGLGASLTVEDETINASGFLFDMNRFFQALLVRLLRENLGGFTVIDEYVLRGMLAYSHSENPTSRRAPSPRPDIVVTSKHPSRIVAILDAKYRDLWANPLPREMLYQLVIYATSQGAGGQATILYPLVTTGQQLSDARILVSDPVYGQGRASVVLRPVDLLKLADLLGGGTTQGAELAEFAERLAFGSSRSVAHSRSMGDS